MPDIYNDDLHPHSPYIEIRSRIDNGFSKGWGFHFQPSEEYWVDCHNHLEGIKTHSDVYKLIDRWFSELDAFRLGKVLVIGSDPELFEILGDMGKQDKRISWLVSIPCEKPNVEVLNSAIENGAIGLKLHNASIMKGLADYKIWLNDQWSRIFELAEKKHIPVLWHVTQRVSKSPYHGGGENSYWSESKEKNIAFNNEDLLKVTIKVLELFPDLKIIGAHQLHMGLERLSDLFGRYKNLYIDTSCGFFLRWADQLYDEDREVYRKFFDRYQDKILFGSDSSLVPGGIDEYLIQSFLCHTRFINQLRLSYKTLQKVSHGNAEKLFNLELMDPVRRGNVRP